jgi:hypothetical protein
LAWIGKAAVWETNQPRQNHRIGAEGEEKKHHKKMMTRGRYGKTSDQKLVLSKESGGS